MAKIARLGTKALRRLVDGGEHGPLVVTVTDRTISWRFYRSRKEYVDTHETALVRLVMKDVAAKVAAKKKSRRRNRRNGK